MMVVLVEKTPLEKVGFRRDKSLGTVLGIPKIQKVFYLLRKKSLQSTLVGKV